MLTLATIAFINHAVNGALRPDPACRNHPLGACSHDYTPRLAGEVDCKQYAAVKLRELILAGAQPRDFVIWRVRTANGHMHAVLVQTSTGLVLDNLIGAVEPRQLKERHEGYVFGAPCDACGDAARDDAAAIRRTYR